jgi:hypothetical protein
MGEHRVGLSPGHAYAHQSDCPTCANCHRADSAPSTDGHSIPNSPAGGRHPIISTQPGRPNCDSEHLFTASYGVRYANLCPGPDRYTDLHPDRLADLISVRRRCSFASTDRLREGTLHPAAAVGSLRR